MNFYPIINDDSLIDDTIEGVSENIKRDLTDAEKALVAESIDEIMCVMFQAQSEWIIKFCSTKLKD